MNETIRGIVVDNARVRILDHLKECDPTIPENVLRDISVKMNEIRDMVTAIPDLESLTKASPKLRKLLDRGVLDNFEFWMALEQEQIVGK